MASKRIALLLIALIIALMGVLGAIRSPTIKRHLFLQQVTAEPGTLDWYAQQAQVQGASGYTFNASEDEYVQPNSWDEVLSGFSFVIAQPVQMKTYATADQTNIDTWIKFRISETLSQKPVDSCAVCPPVPTPPSDMLPLQANEILISKPGGTIGHNGIQLTAFNQEFPDFLMSQQYLLIIDLYSSIGTGNFSMGSAGVYIIGSDGLLTPIQPEINPYSNDLASRYGNSINQLRTVLNPTPPPPPSSCNPTQEQWCNSHYGDWNPDTCTCSNACATPSQPWRCQ